MRAGQFQGDSSFALGDSSVCTHSDEMLEGAIRRKKRGSFVSRSTFDECGSQAAGATARTPFRLS
jgi:hypothetical protein